MLAAQLSMMVPVVFALAVMCKGGVPTASARPLSRGRASSRREQVTVTSSSGAWSSSADMGSPEARRMPSFLICSPDAGSGTAKPTGRGVAQAVFKREPREAAIEHGRRCQRLLVEAWNRGVRAQDDLLDARGQRRQRQLAADQTVALARAGTTAAVDVHRRQGRRLRLLRQCQRNPSAGQVMRDLPDMTSGSAKLAVRIQAGHRAVEQCTPRLAKLQVASTSSTPRVSTKREPASGPPTAPGSISSWAAVTASRLIIVFSNPNTAELSSSKTSGRPKASV